MYIFFKVGKCIPEERLSSVLDSKEVSGIEGIF